MSIQPVNKAIWGGGGGGEKKKKAVNCYLIKNSGGGGGGDSQKQSEGLSGVLWVYKMGLKSPVMQWQSLENLSLSLSLPSSIMSQSILCNYFKVCTKLTLEGTE